MALCFLAPLFGLAGLWTPGFLYLSEQGRAYRCHASLRPLVACRHWCPLCLCPLAAGQWWLLHLFRFRWTNIACMHRAVNRSMRCAALLSAGVVVTMYLVFAALSIVSAYAAMPFKVLTLFGQHCAVVG